MITETRKAIIELIEPYMDKTKSQFALVTHQKYDGEIQQLEMELDNYTFWYIKECEVIGHYDITAVLKYIQDRNEDVVYWYDNENLYFELTDGYINTPNEESCVNEYEYKIPNKPLHLYIKQEEKELLKLLLKLNKND